MRAFVCFFLLLWSIISQAQNSLPPIGAWREHLPYHSATDLSLFQNKLVVATPYSLYTYSPDNEEIERFSQMGTLSETGIQFIHALASGDLLMATYKSNLIDLLTERGKKTIYDINRSSQIQPQSLYQAFSENNSIYISSSIGIIWIDAEKAEVKETWRIGSNGQSTPVFSFIKFQNQYYAATAEGLKSAASTTANLADYNNWTLASGNNGLPIGAVNDLLVLDNHLICRINQHWYRFFNNNWNLFYSDNAITKQASVQNNRLVLSQIVNNQQRIVFISPSADVIASVSNPVLQNVKKIIGTEAEAWIADSISGLLHYQNGEYHSIAPASPASISEGKIIWAQQKLWATRGAVLNNTGKNLSGAVFMYDQQQWFNYTSQTEPVLETIPDIHSITVGEKNNEWYTASWGAGVQRWQNGKIIAVFQQAELGSGSLTIASVSTDKNNRIWIGHQGSQLPIKVFDPAANFWFSLAIPYQNVQNQIKDIVVDSKNQKWIIAGPSGLLAYHEGNTWNETADDRWRNFQFGSGNGNLPGTIVTTAIEDKRGFIWVGTNQGIGIIECGDVFNNNSCQTILPVVRSGNFAGHLFREMEIRSITVDPANRKWIGTNSGAWLVSANGDSVLQHFNTGNSPILHNQVHSITIDPVTGEVFFATANGICSWRAAATEPNETAQIQVFPNPVPPDYEGTIGIRGLMDNSIVKIMEQNGRLVYQTRSLGGQAVWNGRDYRGNRPASGVYLILVSGEGRKEKTAGKIVFISK